MLSLSYKHIIDTKITKKKEATYSTSSYNGSHRGCMCSSHLLNVIKTFAGFNRKPGHQQGVSGFGPSYFPFSPRFYLCAFNVSTFIGFECDFTTDFRWGRWNRLHTPLLGDPFCTLPGWRGRQPRRRRCSFPRVPGETPCLHPLQSSRERLWSWEGTHQGDNGTFGRQLSSTEQCPNKPVNLLLLWVVFIIIWWHFGFLGKEMFSDDWPPNKNRREIIKHYQKEEITERG